MQRSACYDGLTRKDEPKIKKGEETGTVDPGSGSTSGGAAAGW